MLRIEGEKIEPEKLFTAFREFYALVSEVSKNVYNGQRVQWHAQVKDLSNGLVLTPADPTQSPLAPVAAAFNKGFKQISTTESQKLPDYFSPKAVEHVHKLATVWPPKVGKPTRRISISGNGSHSEDALIVSDKIASGVSRFVTGTREETGEVDGLLQVIDAHKGFKFRIYDELSGLPVICNAPEGKENEIKRMVVDPDKFEHRVSATGLVAYSVDGRPVHLTVKTIKVIPSNKDLPDEEDMKKLFRGMK